MASYQAYCQACHEADQGIGPRLTPEVLASRGAAARLYSYNRDKMPYNAGGSLSDEEFWDITAYLLGRSALIAPDVLLHSRNADDLGLSPPQCP